MALLFQVLYNALPRTAETGKTLFGASPRARSTATRRLLQVGVSALAWFAVGAWWFRRKDY